jgi:hypothetical protein
MRTSQIGRTDIEELCALLERQDLAALDLHQVSSAE